jgi:Arc/MetJ-type ribon-helix-helix transcriptional regulator
MKSKRPEQTGTLIGVRLQPDQLQRLDDWIESDGGRFSRPEAIRRLLEHAWGRTVASRGIKEMPQRVKSLED